MVFVDVWHRGSLTSAQAIEYDLNMTAGLKSGRSLVLTMIAVIVNQRLGKLEVAVADVDLLHAKNNSHSIRAAVH